MTLDPVGLKSPNLSVSHARFVACAKTFQTERLEIDRTGYDRCTIYNFQRPDKVVPMPLEIKHVTTLMQCTLWFHDVGHLLHRTFNFLSTRTELTSNWLRALIELCTTQNQRKMVYARSEVQFRQTWMISPWLWSDFEIPNKTWEGWNETSNNPEDIFATTLMSGCRCVIS